MGTYRVTMMQNCSNKQTSPVWLVLQVLTVIGLVYSGGCNKKVTQSLGGMLQVSIDSWETTVPFGGPGNSQTFSVSISGGGVSPVTITYSKPWVGIQMDASETPLQVNITTTLVSDAFPGDTLAVGIHYDTLVVTVPGAAGSPALIPIQITVLPQLVVLPNQLKFISALGDSGQSPQSLTLLNSGTGDIPYTAFSGAAWLQVNPASGTLPDTVEISIDNTGLAPGVYGSSVSFATTGTFTPSQAVLCTLVVASWLPQSTPLRQDIRSIDFADSQNGCAVGVIISIQGNPPVVTSEGFSLVTTDGGDTWALALPLLPSALGSIDFSAGSFGWAVGGDGLIAKTFDGGVSWEVVDMGITTDLFDVFFLNADTGWIVGDSGMIMRTTDAGSVWEIIPIRPTFKSLSSVHFVDGMTGWAVGNGGTILSSINGGGSWASQSPPAAYDFRGVFMRSATRGWAVGKFGAVMFFDGIDWVQQLSGTTDELRDAQFITSDIGWAVGFHGTILYTSDGGTTWTRQAIDVESKTLFFCVKFLDALNGWVAGSEGTLFHTSNGGN
jgi:photosystem II stability/assembly factor-like uncharacterized protein